MAATLSTAATVRTYKRQLEDALKRDDVQTMRNILASADAAGIPPFDAVVTKARLRVYTAARSTTSAAAATAPAPTAAGSTTMSSAASTSSSLRDSPTAAVSAGRAAAAGSYTAAAAVGPRRGGYHGSSVIASFDDDNSVAPPPRSESTASSNAAAAPTTRILGASTTWGRSDAHFSGSRSNASTAPSHTASAAMAAAAGGGRGGWEALPDPWGSYRHPWADAVPGTSGRYGQSAGSAGGGFTPTVSALTSATGSPTNRRSDASASMYASFGGSPGAVTSVIHRPVSNADESGDLGGSWSQSSQRGTRPPRFHSDIAPALRSLVLRGTAVESVVLQEQRERGHVDGAERRELTHELERFSDHLRRLQARTLRRAVVAIEDDEVLLRQRLATDALRQLERFSRDFHMFTIGADAQEHVRTQERMHRQSLLLQEETYRRRFATGVHRAITSAIADWRRSSELLAIEASAANLCKVAEFQVGGVEELPIMSSRPSSPHQSAPSSPSKLYTKRDSATFADASQPWSP